MEERMSLEMEVELVFVAWAPRTLCKQARWRGVANVKGCLAVGFAPKVWNGLNFLIDRRRRRRRNYFVRKNSN